MKKELDDMENGDDVDNSEEASETADTDKAAGTDPSGTAGEPGKEDLSLMAQIKREDAGDLRQASERRIQFRRKFYMIISGNQAGFSMRKKTKKGNGWKRNFRRQQKSRMRWIVSWPRV